jgi:hypothetical protein
VSDWWFPPARISPFLASSCCEVENPERVSSLQKEQEEEGGGCFSVNDNSMFCQHIMMMLVPMVVWWCAGLQKYVHSNVLVCLNSSAEDRGFPQGTLLSPSSLSWAMDVLLLGLTPSYYSY